MRELIREAGSAFRSQTSNEVPEIGVSQSPAAAVARLKNPQRPEPPKPRDPREGPLAAFCRPNNKRWCGWRYKFVPGRNGKPGKWTKVPLQITGKLAESNDPTTWTIFEEIWPAVQKGKQFDGVGFMLLGLQAAFIDLDNVRDPETGEIVAWAQEVIDVAGSYTERTPSGTGIRIGGIAPHIKPIHTKIAHPSGIGSFELFINLTTGRFITVTGRRLEGTPDTLADISDVVRKLAAIRPSHRPTARGNDSQHPYDTGNGNVIDLHVLSPLIAELIEHGTENGTPVEHPGAQFHRAVIELRRRGFNFADARATFEAYPDGVRSARGALEKELRRSWDRPHEGGPLFDENYAAAVVAEANARAGRSSVAKERGNGETTLNSVRDEGRARPNAPPPPMPPESHSDEGCPEPEPPPADREEEGEGRQQPEPSPRGRRQNRPDVVPASASILSTVWNPWEDPPPPAWPNHILSPQAEAVLADVGIKDGIDLGLLCTTILAGASAATNKAARFYPYHHGTNRDQHAPWAVPPVTWIMPVGESGFRKSRLDAIGFSAIREVHTERWGRYKAEYRAWERRPKNERGPEPEEPPILIVNDFTPEALQNALVASNRGTALIADELVAMLEFGRYGKTGGAAGRGFLLSGYEDAPYPVHRVNKNRTMYIEHTGFSVFGGIQPRRLETFKADLETDGLLQRFVYILVPMTCPTRPDVNVGPGMAELHKAIRQLCSVDARTYRTTPDGIDLIHQTELAAADYATITEYGEGWRGFCRKLHGTHARFALVLHLLEGPENGIIPTERIQRAHRFIHKFVLQHASDFYASLPGSARDMHRDIGGWLLTRGEADPSPRELERILASDLTHGVKSCRPLGSRAIGEVLDRFVTGGWLMPENDYPNNRAWFFNPAIRCRFAEQLKAERQRRAAIRALVERIADDREAWRS